MKSPPNWRVRLYGQFELFSPDGERILLPTTRTEALVSVLVVHRRNGVSRDELASILWTSADPAKAKASLRQALFIIRKACPGLLDTQGHRCRISEDVAVESDYDDPSLRESQVFMPGMEGDWFEVHRSYEEPAPTVPAGLPVDGFLQLLLWLGDNDPANMLGLMLESLALVDGIGGPDIHKIIEKLPSTGKFLGWKHYFVGRVALGGNIKISEHHTKAAAVEALKNSDRDLLVYSLRDLLTLNVLLNKLGEAQAISKRLTEACARRKSPVGASANFLGKALILLHSGAQVEGFQYLRQSQDASQGVIEAAMMESLRAFFHLSYGEFDLAESRLQVPNRIGKEIGHDYLHQICELTRTTMMVKKANEDGVVDTLDLASTRADSLSSLHFRIYIKESIALRYLQSGDLRRAGRIATDVRKIRRGLSMAYTPWDEMRLAVHCYGAKRP